MSRLLDHGAGSRKGGLLSLTLRLLVQTGLSVHAAALARGGAKLKLGSIPALSGIAQSLRWRLYS